MKKILSVVIALALFAIPAISLASYGGGGSSIGSSLTKDVCPDGDHTNSYYDNDCGNSTTPTEEPEAAVGATVDGYIFFDTNKNGSFDGGEQGVQGAVVTLKTAGGAILDTDVTNSGGYYAFYNVAPGVYRVHVSLPATRTTFAQDLLALFVPSVHAANDYEFTVVVEEGETGSVRTDTIPLVDGVVSTTTETPTEDATETPEPVVLDTTNDDTESIFDLIKASNEGNGSITTYVPTTTGVEDAGIVAPVYLPATGVSL